MSVTRVVPCKHCLKTKACRQSRRWPICNARKAEPRSKKNAYVQPCVSWLKLRVSDECRADDHKVGAPQLVDPAASEGPQHMLQVAAFCGSAAYPAASDEQPVGVQGGTVRGLQGAAADQQPGEAATLKVSD